MRERFEKSAKEHEPKFKKAVAERDAETDAKAKEALQKEVTKYYDLMYSHGYFRDSYNNSSLLWQYDLSWWTDVSPMLAADGILLPDQSATLLAMLDAHAESFQANLAALDQKGRDYFTDKDKQFRAFLKEAIAEKLPIEASL